MKIVFLVHDILPITHEEFFVKDTKQKHEQYILTVFEVADLIITTTKTGTNELIKYNNNQNKMLPKIEHIYLGADINSKINNINTINNKNQFLMVGTIEPRKAHKQVIKAFEIIWNEMISKKSSEDIPKLTIIGKKGWLSDDTINIIENHPYLNKYLFYKQNVSDEELAKQYSNANTLIMASYAEGFGLPLIEAMYYKKNIIARDIPVFKEIASNYPIYFSNNNPINISNAIIESLHKDNNKNIYYHNNNWENHIESLLNLIIKVIYKIK